MDLIHVFIFISAYFITKNILEHDECREIIEKCIPDAHFIRQGTKENYIYYQYFMNGKDVKVGNLQRLLSEYIGRPVLVFFDRVLTVRVYRKSLPEEWELPPSLSEKKGVCIGVGVNGEVYHDFNKYPHLVIAGSTGYGKTNIMKCIMSQIPSGSNIVLIDLKNSDDFKERSAGNIKEAREVLESVGRNTYVFIDEAHELMPKSYMSRKEGRIYRECLEIVSEIARMGRSKGIRLIYATQYPTADVLPREIKQNAEARIVFRLVTETASRVALDEGGAERLKAGLRGRAIYKTDRYTEIQTPKWNGEENFNVSFREKETKRVRDYVDIG